MPGTRFILSAAARQACSSEIGAGWERLARALGLTREQALSVIADGARRIHATLGAGVIDFGLRRAQNLSWQSFDVNRDVRARMKGQQPAIVWFTGLSGSGKSTVAVEVERLAGVRPDVFVPADFKTLDTAALRGKVPAQVASGSPFVAAVSTLLSRF